MFQKFKISWRKNVFGSTAKSFKQVRYKHEWIQPQGFDTGIKIYNRIEDKKVPLIFLNKNFVKWYICGPTVYDVAHIGHASCYMRFDIIRRILEQFFDVRPVIALGITDIDDKVIKKAKKLNKDFRLVTKEYETQFLKELNELNILPPSFILRVTDHIPEIIDFVSTLIKQGNGYPTEDGSVYFNTNGFQNYGKLHVPPEEGSAGLHVGQKHFLDFALWKGSKPDEPFWESPWGKGRPGWHIECSVMASKYFGSQLDLHSGGIDLVFPHHENEEAQSCAYHNCSQWVNYWMHSGHLMIEEEKMSKSLFNFISISDFLKTYTPDNLRMFCFVSSYKKGLHYGSGAMDLAVNMCEKISQFMSDSTAYINGNWPFGNVSEALLMEELEKTSSQVKECLTNDFDTANCFISLLKLVQTTTKMLNDQQNPGSSRSSSSVAAVLVYVSHMFKNFGFHFESALSNTCSYQNTLENVTNAVVNFRSQVREEALLIKEKSLKTKLLQACDILRNDLGTAGIAIKDQGNGISNWYFTHVKQNNEKIKTESGS